MQHAASLPGTFAALAQRVSCKSSTCLVGRIFSTQYMHRLFLNRNLACCQWNVNYVVEVELKIDIPILAVQSSLISVHSTCLQLPSIKFPSSNTDKHKQLRQYGLSKAAAVSIRVCPCFAREKGIRV